MKSSLKQAESETFPRPSASSRDLHNKSVILSSVNPGDVRYTSLYNLKKKCPPCFCDVQSSATLLSRVCTEWEGVWFYFLDKTIRS
jgi:hypothetical protein